MRSVSSIIPVLALAMGAMADSEWHFGDTVYMGPTTNAYIKKATYSLVPPAVPTDSSQSDAWLSIWIGKHLSHHNWSYAVLTKRRYFECHV